MLSENAEQLNGIPEGWHLGLRTCGADGSSHGGFVWPKDGMATAPDWKKTAECGNGLHFLPWGEGDGGLLSWSPDARWLVVAYDPAEAVLFGDKGKSRRCLVVHCGDQKSATDFLAANGAIGRAIAGGTATAGYGGTATAGDGGVIVLRWWDSAAQRCRVAVGYVGEGGIEAGVRYRLNDRDEFVRADEGEVSEKQSCDDHQEAS